MPFQLHNTVNPPNIDKGSLTSNLIITDDLNVFGTLTLEPGSTVIGGDSAALPPALESIANLETGANQMIYTTSGSVYAATDFSPYSRGLLINPDSSSWRSGLSLVPGVHVQTQNQNLQDISNLTLNANEMIYSNGSIVTTTGLTSAGRALLEDGTAADQRTTLGLGTISVLPAPSGDVVGTTDTQSLTNKTLLSPTNTVGATHLFSNTSNQIDIVSSPNPTTGQLLTATSATSATWQDPEIAKTGSTTTDAVVRWDSSGNLNNSTVTISDAGTLTATTLAGPLSTASQPNITSVGTLTSLTTTGNITLATPGATVDGVDLTATVAAYPTNLPSLEDAEVTQLLNINATTISTDAWTHLGTMNQDVDSTATPTFTGLSLNNQKLTDLAAPTNDSDAATKLYVDQNAAGFIPIDSCILTTTVNIAGTYIGSPTFTLTEIGGPSVLSIDGVSPTSGRVLLKDQTDATQNGVYTVENNDGASSWELKRTSDFDSSAEISNGLFVFVTTGSTEANTGWVVHDLASPFTLDTDDILFAQVSASGNTLAGTGMTKAGNTLNVNGTTNRVSVTSTAVDIDINYVGQNSITTLGTVGTGTWNADTIPINKGGTNAVTAPAALTNLGGQPLDPTLTGLAAATVGASDLLLYSTGVNTFTTSSLTAAGRAILDDASATDQRTTLGLGSISVLAAPTGDVVGTTDTQTLSNKSLEDVSTCIIDSVDNTKKVCFDAGTVSSGFTRTFVLPDANGTIVLEDNSSTISGKTFTSCTMTDTSNTVTANQLRTSTGSVDVSASAAPSVGQILAATSPTVAAWITPTAISYERMITVAQSGADHTTITAAIAAAIVLVPTSPNRVVIQIYPGSYVEASTLIMPAFVTLKGMGNNGDVRISIVTDTSLVIDLVPNSRLNNILVENAKGVGGIGIRLNDASSTPAFMDDCAVKDCRIGILATSSSTAANSCVLSINTCVVFNTGVAAFGGVNVDVGFQAGQGSTIGGKALNTSGFLAGGGAFDGRFIIAGYLASGENAFLSLSSCESTFTTNGLYLQNGVSGGEAIGRLNGGIISNCTNGVKIDAFSCGQLFSMVVQDATSFDVNLTSATSTVLGNGNLIQFDKFNIVDGATIFLQHLSSVPADEAIIIHGKLNVGTVYDPSETAMGGGNSHVLGMTVYTALAGDLNFEDWTTEASSATISTFPPWQSTATGGLLYIGGSVDTFPGIKLTVDVATNFTGGSFVAEYWNGAAWTLVNTMVTLSDAPYNQTLTFADDLAYQVRFGQMVGWVQNTVNGTASFWIRFRTTGTITSVGTIEQVKLHTNRMEVNTDGFVEYFGKSRVRRRVTSFSGRFIQSDTAVDPGNQDLYLSKTISVGFIKNAFSDTLVERIGHIFELPFETDTSYDLHLYWEWRAGSTGGKVKWNVYYGFTSCIVNDSGPASNLYQSVATAPVAGPNEQSTTLLSDDVLLDKIYCSCVSCDISGMVTSRPGHESGDVFWFNIERDATDVTDTMIGDADMSTVNLNVVIWCNGEYIG